MSAPVLTVRPLVLAILLALPALSANAQTSSGAPAPATTLSTIEVNASADASAEGLTAPYAGGQVARGGRVGILGNQDYMDTPFSSTNYTNELIQDQQAQSVADVLLNDPAVRSARGFGNFQELYVIRGFQLYSDDLSYNGLYGMLPRQYIASEFLERVEVFRGANTFLNGAAPGGSGIGGAINLLPKRAGNEPTNRVGLGIQTGGQKYLNFDFGRRFGPDDRFGMRLFGVRRDGGTGVKGEDRELSAAGVGFDWRGTGVRISADVGYQNNSLKRGRPSVTPSGAALPSVPDSDANYAQPWTVAKERSTYATVRGEYDVNDRVTAWAAGGVRRGTEFNSLANPTADAAGNTSAFRFDNAREDRVSTGEVGLRAKVRTGSVGHTLVASASMYNSREAGAYLFGGSIASNLYDPIDVARPETGLFGDGSMSNPGLTNKIETHSFAIADTMSFMDDRLLVTAGLRRQSFKQADYGYSSRMLTNEYDRSKVTPVAGVVFKATSQVSLYANYIEGLVRGDRAGNLTPGAGLPVTNGNQTLAPFVSKQKEIGAKFDGGRIGGSIALYTVDRPTSAYRPNGDGTATFGDYAEQRNRGIDLSVYGSPVRGVRLLGGLSLIDADMNKTQDGVNDGKSAIGVPKRQFNLGAEWDIPGVNNLALNALVLHTSKQYASADNSLSLPSWTRVDLGARYLVDIGNNRTLTLRARVLNAFDRSYWASTGGFPGSNYLVQGAPRTFMLNGTIDF